MIRRLLLIVLLIAAPAIAQHAQTAPADHVQPGDVAHGAEETAREVAHGEAAAHHDDSFLGMPGWVAKLINMLLFFGFLYWLVRGPVKSALAGRKERIRQELQEARDRREKSDHMADEIQARLKRLEGEVEMILKRAAEEGERQKQELIAAGNEEAEKILRSARNEVDSRVKQARKELKEYAGELATERAARLVEQSLTEEDRKRLFEEGLGTLAEDRQ